MRKYAKLFTVCISVVMAVGLAFVLKEKAWTGSLSYSEEETLEDAPAENEENVRLFGSDYDRKVRELANWTRPEGPFRVALQAGHWKAGEAPDELPNLRVRTRTSGGGKTEWQVNLEIAEKTKALLEAQGVAVVILPATIPPEYWADLFIAIHADGNLDASDTGYKAASPRRDLTGKAQGFVAVLEAEYAKAAGLSYDPNVTRNMTGYYAFNWHRYKHSLHPKTVSVILETGFLTSPNDRKVIVQNQSKAAEGIARAVLSFKLQHGL